MSIELPRHVGIVGSGLMAAGIAEISARAGLSVLVRGRSADAAHTVLSQVEYSLGRLVEKGKLSTAERDSVLARISTTTDFAELAACDLIIESIVEDLAAKVQVFSDIDKVAKREAILATNTSTLSVGDIARTTARPDRVCGIHFFNPATVLPLVEIVRAAESSDETIAIATAFVSAIGKEGVHVQDRSGFIVNALLFPYLNNAIRMLENGTASMEDIDSAMKGGCGFPMGPFALLDLVGLDTALSILETLHDSFGDENYAPRAMLRDLVREGRLGRKTKAGFYVY
jgi:3-hydroxybutyryl-CoA dehydrogenase